MSKIIQLITSYVRPRSTLLEFFLHVGNHENHVSNHDIHVSYHKIHGTKEFLLIFFFFFFFLLIISSVL